VFAEHQGWVRKTNDPLQVYDLLGQQVVQYPAESVQFDEISFLAESHPREERQP
jgi:hypothetical protein